MLETLLLARRLFILSLLGSGNVETIGAGRERFGRNLEQHLSR
jgi:hypothetical protein